MNTKFVLSALVMAGGIALTAPGFAQTQDESNAPQMPAANSDQSRNMSQDQAQGEDQGQKPVRRMRHHAGRQHQHLNTATGRAYDNGVPAGAYGMDVAPGGGTYSQADVSSEEPDRMSHPVVGERRAPSNMAQGSLADVDQAENDATAKLNQQQMNGETASLPNNE
jgi:hypothetical protein